VKLISPTTSSTSPISLQASASSGHPITGWQVYLDSKDVYTGGPVSSISPNLTATTGSHQLVVRAWDTTGEFGSQVIEVTVTGTKPTPPPQAPTPIPLPTPPSTAKVYTNLQADTASWGNCDSAACAGGTGAGSYWQAFNQSSPSMSGASMELYHDGEWGNALWYHKLGANDAATNFLWDFYVQLDSASQNYGQALEYDAFQFVGGYNYMMGTQCDYGYGVWDTWNEATGQWLHTSIPCKKFAPGSWHHIQWYITTNHTNHTYTYHTLVVDGVASMVNQTEPAKYLGWQDDLGAQWQLDVNASGGGFHEWVDSAKLTVW
jgi:hypothetical protein